ncbi:hypothetical protein [Celeribacter persicus]|jgi:hypothetical protein|uniref:Uncharacterized protein n=1 Tax=Celeribacter persicus TaxID=1651082 RepID=A0A2T5HSM9_9RHOB|nr:hypothetical protein [Celeribacter persicus]PTQ74595.1 hypothetical protein C8N42_104240 [Celeribacter persicus]
MDATQFNDVTLMACANGELDELTFAKIRKAAADDPAITGRIEMFARTASALGTAATA